MATAIYKHMRGLFDGEGAATNPWEPPLFNYEDQLSISQRPLQLSTVAATSCNALQDLPDTFCARH